MFIKRMFLEESASFSIVLLLVFTEMKLRPRFRFDGFSLETCRSLVAMMDVSFVRCVTREIVTCQFD